MKEAFISDVHARYDRLDTAVSRLKKAGYDRMRCLGDVVGDKKEEEWESHQCVDLITKECDKWILGNHDDLAGLARRFSTPCIRDYIANAEYKIREGDIIYVHAEPIYRYPAGQVNYNSYVQTPERAQQVFEKTDAKLVFIGHTHVPRAFGSDGSVATFTESGSLTLKPELRWIVSVGAVGESCDANPETSCAIYDHEKKILTVIRE